MMQDTGPPPCTGHGSQVEAGPTELSPLCSAKPCCSQGAWASEGSRDGVGGAVKGLTSAKPGICLGGWCLIMETRLAVNSWVHGILLPQPLKAGIIDMSHLAWLSFIYYLFILLQYWEVNPGRHAQ